jgi:hypothetical protein
VELIGQKRRLREVKLLEEDSPAGGGETLQIAPFGIKTVKLTLEGRR